MADLRKFRGPAQVKPKEPASERPASVKPKPPAPADAGLREGIAQAPATKKAEKLRAPAQAPAPAEKPEAAPSSFVPPAPAPAPQAAAKPEATLVSAGVQPEPSGEATVEEPVRVPAGQPPVSANKSPAPEEVSSSEFEVIGSGEIEAAIPDVPAAPLPEAEPAESQPLSGLPELDLSLDLGSASLDAGALGQESGAQPVQKAAAEQTIRKEKLLAFTNAGDNGFIMRGLKLTYQFTGPSELRAKLIGKGVEQDLELKQGRETHTEITTPRGVVSVTLTYRGANEQGAKEVHAIAEGTTSAMDLLEKTRKMGISLKGSVTWMRRHVADIIVGTFLAASSTAILTLGWVKATMGPLHPWVGIGYAVAGAALVAWQAIERNRYFKKEEKSQ